MYYKFHRKSRRSVNPDLIIVNYEYSSMVRVLYEGTMLTNILTALAANINNISPFSRANFVSDYFAFAENEPLTGINIEETLTNTQFMVAETEYVVWVMFNQGMDYIWTILKYTENSTVLDDYVQFLVNAYYNKYGWDQNLSNIRLVHYHTKEA